MHKKIVPAILEKNFEAIREKVSSVREVSTYVQIDIVDGVFADAVSWPFTEKDVEKNLDTYLKRIGDLQVRYELDMMVTHPEHILEGILASSAHRIIIHMTSTGDLKECISALRKDDREVYIAIGVNDNIQKLKPYIKHIDGIQCMGIAHIGRQGEEYDQRVEDVITSIRHIYEDIPISVDGAQSAKTIPRLSLLGVQQFCVGSAIFNGDAEENIQKLEELLYNST